MNAIAEHTSYSILALYGPSGVGKSTVMKRIAQHCREEEKNPACVPVVIVEASPEDVGSSARLDFYRRCYVNCEDTWRFGIECFLCLWRAFGGRRAPTR